MFIIKPGYQKLEYKYFKKRVKSELTSTDKALKDVTETQKNAILKLKLNNIYSSEFISKISDYTLINRRNRLIQENDVLYRNVEALVTSIMSSFLVKMIDLPTSSLLLQLLFIPLIAFSTFFFIKIIFAYFSLFNEYVAKEISKHEIDLIEKELDRREANHKKVHQKENGKVKVTVKRIK